MLRLLVWVRLKGGIEKVKLKEVQSKLFVL